MGNSRRGKARPELSCRTLLFPLHMQMEMNMSDKGMRAHSITLNGKALNPAKYKSGCKYLEHHNSASRTPAGRLHLHLHFPSPSSSVSSTSEVVALPYSLISSMFRFWPARPLDGRQVHAAFELREIGAGPCVLSDTSHGLDTTLVTQIPHMAPLRMLLPRQPPTD
jgi:hypothetical protein